MENVTVSLGDILWLLGGIITIGGVIALVAKALKPFKDLTCRVGALEIHDKKDNERLKEVEEGQRVTQRSLLAISEHLRTGNGVDKLEDAEKALKDYLIAK